MLFEKDTVQALIDFGLTVSQAKVYLALAKLGPLTVKTTAQEQKLLDRTFIAYSPNSKKKASLKK